MRFTGFGLLTSLSLFAFAASALVAMHLLRSRPNRVRVVTTMFWTAAKSAIQPRSFWHRFHQWVAFLILLLAATLCVLSTSEPIVRSAGETRHVVMVIDAGMSMAAVSDDDRARRMDEAIQAAKQTIASLGPGDRLAVIAVDPLPRVLHGFDQPHAAARTALPSLNPADSPASSESALKLARALLGGRQGPTIVHITDRSDPVGASYAGETAPTVHSIRVGKPSANAAILFALFVPDERIPTQGKLRVRAGWFAQAEGEITVRAKTLPTGDTLIEERMSIQPGRIVDVTSSSLRADGRKVQIELSETQGISADNQLTVRLPIRDEIHIAAAPDLPTSLRLALESGPAALTAPDNRNATIRAAIDPADTKARTRPEINLITDGDAAPSGSPVLVVQDSTLTRGLSLENAISGTGPGLRHPPDANRFTPLLTGGGSTLAALDETIPEHPRLLLSAALFAEDATVPNHPAFAMLISRSVRRLAGWPDPFMPIPVERVWSDPTWTNPIDVKPGSVLIPGSRTASNLVATVPAAADASLLAGNWLTTSRLMLLFVLLLITIDAVLHARGRIV